MTPQKLFQQKYSSYTKDEQKKQSISKVNSRQLTAIVIEQFQLKNVQNTSNIKSSLHTDYFDKNIEIPTQEEYITQLISKVDSTYVIPTKAYQFQLTNYGRGENTVNIKNIPISTKDKYKIHLISKDGSSQIIPRRIYKFQLRKSSK